MFQHCETIQHLEAIQHEAAGSTPIPACARSAIPPPFPKRCCATWPRNSRNCASCAPTSRTSSAPGFPNPRRAWCSTVPPRRSGFAKFRTAARARGVRLDRRSLMLSSPAGIHLNGETFAAAGALGAPLRRLADRRTLPRRIIPTLFAARFLTGILTAGYTPEPASKHRHER